MFCHVRLLSSQWCCHFLRVASVSLSLTACKQQCLSCEGADACTSCRDPAKVLLFGECQYEGCAQQYYLNTTTRTCTGNFDEWQTFLKFLRQ